MTEFVLDNRLKNDCILLKSMTGMQILLMNNRLVPWFILVPETDQIELHQLPEKELSRAIQLQNRMAQFIESNFSVDKINIAAIGNVVSQLHIHVIGRRKDDYCWPNVVWGNPQKAAYTAGETETIRTQLHNWLSK